MTITPTPSVDRYDAEPGSLHPPPARSQVGSFDRGPARLSAARAIQLDALSTRSIALHSVWQRVCEGSWIVRETFSTDYRYYSIFRPRTAADARVPDPGDVSILQRALCGERHKVVAIEMKLSNSTVTYRLGRCLAAMGLPAHRSRSPAILVAAATTSASLADGRVTRIDQSGVQYTIVSVPRFENFLVGRITHTELKIVKLLVDGMTHREMASTHRSSPRTVANHLSSIFRKLRISGRAELLCYLARNFRPLAISVDDADTSRHRMTTS